MVGGVKMNIILDNEQKSLYLGKYTDVDYEVLYDKDKQLVTLIVDSSLLGQSHYKMAYAHIYGEVLKKFQKSKEISFEVYFSNELEQERGRSLVNEFQLAPYVKLEKKQKKESRIENYFRASIIQKLENGQVKTYLSRSNDSFRGEYVLAGVEMADLERELQKLKEEKHSDLENLSDQEIANMVIDRLAVLKKQYRLESSLAYSSKNQFEDTAIQATNLDDKVNPEVGIVKKNPDDNLEGDYRVVEKDGNKQTVVQPTIRSVYDLEKKQDDQEINLSSQEENLSSKEIISRKEECVYYVDYYTLEIYRQDWTLVGKVGKEFQIDGEKNNLMQNGKVIGVVSDIRSFDVSLDRNKKMIRTLEKNQNNQGIIDFSAFMLLIVVMSVLGLTIYFISR